MSPVALAMNSAVTGLGMMAVRMPAEVVELVMHSVSSRPAATLDRPSRPNRPTMLMQTGSRMAVRAVEDGTRKASVTLATVTPRVIRRGEQPTRARMWRAMRSASPVRTIAVARTKAPTIRYTEDEAMPSSAPRRFTTPPSTAAGTTIRLATASGMASVKQSTNTPANSASAFWP